MVGLLVGAVLMLALPARAADAPASLGPPVVLFSPASPTVTQAPIHSAAEIAPAKRPVAPARSAPIDAKPLIPPAPAKLSPPPEPRPALSLETDLQPLTVTPPTPPTGEASPPVAKPAS
jgi:hypothetical protein